MLLLFLQRKWVVLLVDLDQSLSFVAHPYAHRRSVQEALFEWQQDFHVILVWCEMKRELQKSFSV